jgi:hypothetical protein
VTAGVVIATGAPLIALASIGFEIPKSSTLTVPGLERCRDLERYAHRLIGRDRSLGDPVRERRPIDELHDDNGLVAGPLEAVDRRDVRMIQRREDLRFALKAREAILVFGDGFGEDLDGHVALETRVGRTIDLTHAA